MHKEDTLIRRLLHASNRLVARVYHQLDVLSPCTIPREGPAILVSNHTSGLDPLLIQSVCPRLIVWMMAKEYYDHPVLGWVYRQVQAIPVARSGKDMAAMREALRALKEGRVLGVFPEGRIAPTRELLPFQPGIALLAARSGAEIYPCYLDGTQRGKEMIPAVANPQHAQIAFGPGMGRIIRRHDRLGLDEQAERIRESIERVSRVVTPH
jgi:1-acyl-sn-glycerol-3-phosphate acyltransferase